MDNLPLCWCQKNPISAPRRKLHSKISAHAESPSSAGMSHSVCAWLFLEWQKALYIHAGKHKPERIMWVDNSHWHWGFTMGFVKHPPPVSSSHVRKKWVVFLFCIFCFHGWAAPPVWKVSKQIWNQGDNAAIYGWDVPKQNFGFAYFDFRFTLNVFLTGGAGITRFTLAALPLTFQLTITI